MMNRTGNDGTDGRAKLGLIVACSENGVIGASGDLPWSLPDDMRHFMRSTKGHAVIMGRKTFESLEKPLGGRLNIVVSSSMSIKERDPGARWSDWGVVVVRSLDEAVSLGQEADTELGRGLIWIAGGGEIYGQAMGDADLVVLTRVHCVAEGDTTFGELDPQSWVLNGSEEHPADADHRFGFTIERWIRS